MAELTSSSSSSSAGPSTGWSGPSSSAPPLSPTLAAPPGPPPPTYAAMQPQMLIVPLPDAPSFFWGRTLQGEVYVKGLGEDRTQSVASLTVTARLTDRAAGLPDVDIGPVFSQTVYPPPRGDASTSATPSTPSGPDVPFPTSHRFALDLPPAMPDGEPLPGSLDLGAGGAISWTLEARLTLLSGEVLTEKIGIEGTPPDLDVTVNGAEEDAAAHESVAKLEQEGVCVRLVLACARPRLGDMVHIGVEVRPKGRERTGLAGLVAQPDPSETLRPLRRVRVELVRMVDVAAGPESSSANGTHTVTTTLHASGKSLRFPGMAQQYPPLRVLFTLPTAQLHPGMLATGGEISTRTPYHTVRFAVRATLGFGVVHETAAPGSPDLGNPVWTVEQRITVRPPAWVEPPAVLIEGGLTPEPGLGGSSAPPGDSPTEDELSEEEAREAYRRKGRDVVGAAGTFRGETSGGDLPPPFEDEAGPSGTHSEAPEEAGLPTFTESEAQMRSGEAPRLQSAPESARLLPVAFDDDGFGAGAPTTSSADDTPCPRRPSLHGELATWTEYDGYETFSMAPPPVAASFGVQGSMDPPRDEDPHEHAVAGDIAARLGLQGSPAAANPAALMEQLGLGHGRVVDLHDDLPPGIDEPSLPALPGFGDVANVHHGNVRNYGQGYSGQQFGSQQFMDPFTGQRAAPGVEVDHPPSFDASEAAEAVGGVARSRVGSIRLHGSIQISAQSTDGDAPPGYFGSVNSAGPPAYGS